jgi:hypothetical protein
MRAAARLFCSMQHDLTRPDSTRRIANGDAFLYASVRAQEAAVRG